MVTLREALWSLLALTACDSRADLSKAHIFRSIPDTDFACLAKLERTIPCDEAGHCRAADRVSQLIVAEKASCFYGVLSGQHMVVPGLNEAAVHWWAKDRTATLLLIGRNGPRPGWTAPQPHPPGDSNATQSIEPLCGLSTDDPVAVSTFRGWIFDEDHQTFIMDEYLSSMFINHASSGRDADDNIVPDTIGSRELKEPIRRGVVVEKERVEEDLRATANEAVERYAYDPGYNVGVCVIEQ